MVIMTGLKHDGEMYSGGEILDPANGKTYKCKTNEGKASYKWVNIEKTDRHDNHK